MTDVLLDVTRLFRRRRDTAPTGVDRVELAYAEGLPARLGARLRFCLRDSGRLVLVPDAEARGVLAAMTASFGTGGGLDDQAAAGRLGGLPGPRPQAEPAAPAGRRRGAWLSPKAETGLRILRHRLRDVLAASREPVAPGSAYVNVSHLGFTGGGEDIAFVEKLGLAGVFFLHDLIPLTHPEYARPGQDRLHRERLATMLRLGRLILVNSRHTADGLAAHAAQTGRPLPPLAVLPLGIAADWTRPSPPGPPPEPDGGQPPYFVVLGTIEARKNHLMLLNVWRRLAEERGAATPRLVIVGKRGWEAESVFDMLDRCAAIRGHVVEAGSLTDAATVALVRGARAMLFPSFVEGYGMPLVEALACGTPVVASDIPTFREIGAGLVDFVDPLDGPGWIAAIDRLAGEDAAARRARLDAIAGYRPPTWDEHVDGVCAALARL